VRARGGRARGLGRTVAVVDVDVDVQHARVALEQLEDGEHDVVDVAEARGLLLVRVVQPARPVDRDVALPRVQPPRALDRRAGVHRAELVEPLEDRAVLADAVLVLLVGVGVLVPRVHLLEELHVLRRVEARHLRVQRARRHEHVHLLVHPVVHDEVVGHRDAVRLHRVLLAVVVRPDDVVVEVRHAVLRRHGRPPAPGEPRAAMPRAAMPSKHLHQMAAPPHIFVWVSQAPPPSAHISPSLPNCTVSRVHLVYADLSGEWECGVDRLRRKS